ncbi:MAG: hypothetical protein V1899_06475 [Planctomycetota bacterium]
MWMPLLFALPFLLLGVYGGICAINRWVRGYSGYFIFTPIGGAIYFVVLVVLASLFFSTMCVLQQINTSWVFFLFATLPFVICGHVLWAFALMLELFAKGMGPSEMPLAKTFDKGDGLMTRGLFAEAEAQFRLDLADEPQNTDGILRLCRAIESSGRMEDATREMNAVYQRTINRLDDPPLDEDTRSKRLLRLTYALGDLFLKLDQIEQARQLYQQMLKILYDHRDVESLRDRLRMLEK